MTRQADDRLHLRDRHLRFHPARLVIPRLVIGSFILGLATFSVAVLPTQVAGAATDTVTDCSGSPADTGSLPYMVQNAAPGDTVNFSVSCPPTSPIVLTSAVNIGVNLTIEGPGATTLAVSGDNASAVFDVPLGVTATISGLTIEDGSAVSGGGIDNAGTLSVTDSTVTDNAASHGGGGAIENDGGSLTLTDSTVSDNVAYHGGGGGIQNLGGTLTVTDSTLSDNSTFHGGTTVGGGGVENDNGTLIVTDSTFSQNSSDYNGGGGGVFNDNGTVTVTASTFWHNITFRHGGGGGIGNEAGTVSAAATIVANSGAGGDCSGSVTDAGYNQDDDGSCGFSGANNSLSDVDAYLGPLQNNGGPTETHAPALGSPELDQIPVGATGNATTLCPGTDQRGVARPQDTKCDIGAVELSPTSQTITSSDSAPGTAHSPFSFMVTTTGTPTPTLSKKGKLPKHLSFVDNGDGTATISGTPKAAGTTQLTITATFGTGPSTFVVTQVFTLTVGP